MKSHLLYLLQGTASSVQAILLWLILNTILKVGCLVFPEGKAWQVSVFPKWTWPCRYSDTSPCTGIVCWGIFVPSSQLPGPGPRCSVNILLQKLSPLTWLLLTRWLNFILFTTSSYSENGLLLLQPLFVLFELCLRLAGRQQKTHPPPCWLSRCSVYFKFLTAEPCSSMNFAGKWGRMFMCWHGHSLVHARNCKKVLEDVSL